MEDQKPVYSNDHMRFDAKNRPVVNLGNESCGLTGQSCVPAEVQALFNIHELLFTYGDNFEHFDTGFHRVPTTQNIWLAGKDLSREVVITSTAMEAIAYLSVNLYRYPDLNALSFIAVAATLSRIRPAELDKGQLPQQKVYAGIWKRLIRKTC